MRPPINYFKLVLIQIVFWGSIIGLWLYLRSGNEQDLPYHSCSGVVWTTRYNITYQSEKKLDDSIQNVFTSVDNSLSMFNKSSLISRINRGETEEVDSMLAVLYRASVKVNGETDGAFDPTVLPLMKVWGFAEKSDVLPDSVEIDSICSFVGLEKTVLADGRLRRADPRVAFDFSAIAKGFACDEIGRMLCRNGVQNYLVEVGGEIVLNGVNSAGTAWGVSVDSPLGTSASGNGMPGVTVVRMKSGAVATSGNYRNYKEVDGKRIVHTMNPKTGYPEVSSLLSATIFADNCMLADAYATACMVMGVERSVRFLEGRTDIAGLLVYVNETDSLVVWSNHNRLQNR